MSRGIFHTVFFENRFIHLTCFILLVFALSTCGGGGGGSSGSKKECRESASNAGISTLELLDPTPCEDGEFGHRIVVLPNGNVVVADPQDSSILKRNGAVHLFDPFTQTLIKSHYGESKDALFVSRIVPLTNSNFVFRSSDTENVDWTLVNGQTGMSIGEALAGTGITALANDNFVVSSGVRFKHGIVSAMLIDGTTGVQIGNDYRGDNSAINFLITTLENGNFALVFYSEITPRVTVAESTRLFDGQSGAQIGNTVSGNNVGDLLGLEVLNHRVSHSDPIVKDLGNGNFVVASPNDIVAGVSGAGSVILVDGNTGLQIGSDLSGDKEGDLLGFNGVTILSNGNFVISSEYDDHNGIKDAGTVRLIDGVTGALIGNVISGDKEGDMLGSCCITALPNGNFVFSSQFDGAGKVRLVNGTTGLQIGNTLVPDGDERRLGISIKALGNNNFVVVSLLNRDQGILAIGFVRLIDGSTGLQLGSKLTAGENGLLRFYNIATMPNGNFIIPKPLRPRAGESLDLFGGVVLVDGTTGDQIGEIINGQDKLDTSQDGEGDLTFVGKEQGDVFALSNNKFVVLSENEGGKKHNSSIKLIDGVTGLQVGQSIVGDFNNDTFSANFIELENSEFYILSLPAADTNGLKDSGFVGVFPKQ